MFEKMIQMKRIGTVYTSAPSKISQSGYFWLQQVFCPGYIKYI